MAGKCIKDFNGECVGYLQYYQKKKSYMIHVCENIDVEKSLITSYDFDMKNDDNSDLNRKCIKENAQNYVNLHFPIKFHCNDDYYCLAKMDDDYSTTDGE